MIRIKTNEFNKVCRLCSSLHPHLRCISSDSIISMIEDCAPVHVYVDDGLPQFICENCFVLLNKITELRKKCVESEKEFYKSIDEQTNVTGNEAIYLFPAKQEVTESIKTEIVENDAPNTDNVSDYNNSDSETLIKLKTKQSDITEYYKCEICSKVMISFKQIENHLKDEHELKPTECKIRLLYDSEKPDGLLKPDLVKPSNLCNINQINLKKINKNVALTEKTERTRRSTHKLIHTRVKTQTKRIHIEPPITTKPIVKYAECKVCHKKMQRYALYRHMADIHSERKSYPCTDCSKTYLYERYLRIHHKTVHENEPVIKKFLCDLCGHASNKQSDLDRHYATHSTERPYKCDQCHHDYKTKRELKSHIDDKHLNIKPFVCSHCGHAFTRRKFLEDHVRTHTGEKPFKCKFCEQAFSSDSGLYIHNRTHHRLK